MKHPGFDSMLRLDEDVYLFQFLENENQFIDVTDLEKQVDRILQLAPKSIIHLVFVVPPETAEKFMPIEPVDGVSQYVLPFEHHRAPSTC